MLNQEELLYIEETAHGLSDWTIQHRRSLHRIPETAWTENLTTAYLEHQLYEMGYRITKGDSVAGHSSGLIAEIGSDSSIVIGLRFDIDGLPVNEVSDSSHLPYREGFASTHPGKMHACGHDGHMAIGLTVAKILADNLCKLRGTIRLLFQPAEEGCRGAREVVKLGWLKDVDYFLAGHIVGREYGKTQDGPADCVTGVNGSLATSKINASIYGTSCHGACPENGASAITALCSTVLALNGIPRNSHGSTMINIGMIQGGEGRNIVAAHASMELEVRGETTELNQYMEDQALQIIEAGARLHNCRSEIKVVGKAPSLVSSLDFQNRIKTTLRAVSTIKTAESGERFKASEDAALLMEEVKSHGGQAVFMLFPTDTTAPLHCENYDFDESVLTTASVIYSVVVFDLLSQ